MIQDLEITQGVSTLAPSNRLPGFATKQINFRSDPEKKLVRRPPLQWDADLVLSETNTYFTHSYVKDGDEYRIVLLITGEAICYKNNIPVITNNYNTAYVGGLDNLVMKTIGHDTYVINTETVPSMKPNTDDSDGVIEKVTYINFTSALGYAEQITVRLRTGLFGLDEAGATVTYTAPQLGNANQDAHRATNYVATQFHDFIAANYPNFKVRVLGSTLAVWNAIDPTVWPILEVESGEGDRISVVVNEIIESTKGLPLYAVHGTRITIRPDPTSDNGTYYLEAKGTAPDSEIAANPDDRIMQEVVWTEDRSPNEKYCIAETTMPYRFTYVPSANQFFYQEGDWKDRRTGDNDSCPAPEFIGHPIKTMEYFQNRLCFIADNKVFLSETDDVHNWWKASALQLLVTDPITIASSAVGVDTIKQAIMHNRDLLCVAANAQFKLSGDIAQTPRTAALPLVTSYKCNADVEPVQLGNSVFLPLDYGDSTGILEFKEEPEKQSDEAVTVTDNVVGLLGGKCLKMVANSNLDTLFVLCDRDGNGKPLESFLYVMEREINSARELEQLSWSIWETEQYTKILDINLLQNKLKVLYAASDFTMQAGTIDLFEKFADTESEIYLDNVVKISSINSDTFFAPLNYDVAGMVVVVGEDGDFPMTEVGYTQTAPSTYKLDEEVCAGNCKLYLGRKVRASYRPTRPFIYDRNGRADVIDKLRIRKYHVSVVNSHEVKMEIDTPYYDYEDQVQSGRILGSTEYLLGQIPLTTTKFEFSFRQDASMAEAEFYTDGFLNLNIIGLSWEGQQLPMTRGRR